MPSGVVRWIFEEVETGDSYTVEINPKEMESYTFPRELSWGKWDSRMSGIGARGGPLSWSFGGNVYTKTHHDALIEWQKKPGKVRITDHLGRTFEVMIESVDMLDRRQTAANQWRFTYTFHAMLLRRIA